MGVVVTIIGLKSGAKIYNKAVTDMTQPPEFQTEDRTSNIPNYDYNNYEDHYRDLEDNERN